MSQRRYIVTFMRIATFTNIEWADSPEEAERLTRAALEDEDDAACIVDNPIIHVSKEYSIVKTDVIQEQGE